MSFRRLSDAGSFSSPGLDPFSNGAVQGDRSFTYSRKRPLFPTQHLEDDGRPGSCLLDVDASNVRQGDLEGANAAEKQSISIEEEPPPQTKAGNGAECKEDQRAKRWTKDLSHRNLAKMNSCQSMEAT